MSSFARIETVKMMLIEGQTRLIILLHLMQDAFDGQTERLDLPLTMLPRLMDFTGVRDFDDLRGKIVRLEIDTDGEPLNLAGPGDGQWLLDTLNPDQGADAALTV